MLESVLNSTGWLVFRFGVLILSVSVFCSMSMLAIGYMLPSGGLITYETMDYEVYVVDVDHAISVLLMPNANSVPYSSLNSCQPVFVEQIYDTDIYAWNVDTNQHEIVLSIPARYIGWLSDEHNLAYELGDEIYVTEIGGGITPSLTTSFNRPAKFPTWSTDGQQIVFAGGDGIGWGIFIVNVDGTNLRRMSDPDISLDFRPSHFRWSDDGLQLFFIVDYNPAGPEVSLYTLDVETGTIHLLVNHLVQFGIDWQDIAVYSGEVRPGSDIYVFDPTQDEAHINLTNDPFNDIYPVWSPDGQRIAFFSQRETMNWGIYVMDRNGSNLRRLAEPSDLNLWQAPVWGNSCP